MKMMTKNEKKICLFTGGDIMVVDQGNGHFRLPSENETLALLPQDTTIRNVSTRSLGDISATQIDDTTASGLTSLKRSEFRPLFLCMDADEFEAACKAKQIVFWDSHSKYCPSCGTQTYLLTDIAKKCPNCGHEQYPPITPAIIVRIERGDEILLVHNLRFRTNFYGLVAGFVEAGETFEQCVEREVMEETGLKVKNIKYFGNQSWPFPSGIMIGYTAEYASGSIKIQEDELTDARFFNKDNLPELPGKMSIARRLIDDWIRTSTSKNR